MSSERQIQANRANAARSTGPRTPEGKEASRQNAVKHGLTARTTVLLGEDAVAYNDLIEDLMQQYQPLGALQEQLVRHLASCLWRLQRVPTFEAMAFESSRYGSRTFESVEECHLTSLTNFVITNDVLGKLARHEVQLFKQVQATLKMLGDPKHSFERTAKTDHASDAISSRSMPAASTQPTEALVITATPADIAPPDPTPQTSAPQASKMTDGGLNALPRAQPEPQPQRQSQSQSNSTPAGNSRQGPVPIGKGMRTTADGIVLTM
jgi:hypothetical protein